MLLMALIPDTIQNKLFQHYISKGWDKEHILHFSDSFQVLETLFNTKRVAPVLKPTFSVMACGQILVSTNSNSNSNSLIHSYT